MQTRVFSFTQIVRFCANAKRFHVETACALLQQCRYLQNTDSSSPPASRLSEQQNKAENDISFTAVNNKNKNNEKENTVETITMRERFCRQCDAMVKNEQLSREAANDYIYQYDHFPLLREVLEKSLKVADMQDNKKLAEYERKILFDKVTDEMITRVAKETNDVLDREQAIVSYMEKGKPTKYNLWIEEQETLMSTDVPENVKSDIFNDMQRHRKNDTSPEKVESEKILYDLASKDKEFAEYLRKQQSEQKDTEKKK